MDIRIPETEVPVRGARKRAVARVWLIDRQFSSDTPQVYVNRKPMQDYFRSPYLQKIVLKPLEITQRIGRYLVYATVEGGGESAQAQAVAHGISRALEKKEPELRKLLKPHKLLTRDPREVERKKYGRRKARKTQQWKKR